MIALATEKKFTKPEVCSKNEVFNKFLNNNNQKNNNNKMEDKIFNFGDTFNPSDSILFAVKTSQETY